MQYKYFCFVSVLIISGCATLDVLKSENLSGIYQQGIDVYRFGDYQLAKKQWLKGIDLVHKEINVDSWDAKFNLALSQLAENYSEYDRSLGLAKHSLNIAFALKDKLLQAEALTLLGKAYINKENLTEGEEYAKKANLQAKELRDLTLESENTRNLGTVLKKQGKNDQASTNYKKSLALAIKAKDDLLQAKALNNLGELALDKAMYQEALDLFNQSLQIRKAINDYFGQEKVLGHLYRIYRELNQNEHALKSVRDALTIARKIQDKSQEAKHLNDIASYFFALKHYQEAEDYFGQSLNIKKAMKDRAGEARTLNNLAEIYRRQGNNRKALEYYLAALKLQKHLVDISGQSATYCNMGIAYSKMGQQTNALDSFSNALIIQNQLVEPDRKWRIYAKLSKALSNMNKQQGAAIFFGKLAVNTIQSIRSNNQNLAKTDQKSYLIDKRQVYEQLANMLIDQGRLLEAEQVLDMLKEEEYFDFTQRQVDTDPSQTQASLTKSETKYATEYLEISKKLIPFGEEYAELDQKVVSGHALNEQQKKRHEDLTKKLDKARESYGSFISELSQVFVKEKQSNEFTNSILKEREHIQGILTELENTVLIYYFYTDEKLRIILTQKNLSVTPALYEVPVSGSELNHLIAAFKQKLKDQEDISDESNQLYKYLIEPIKADLVRLKTKTLMIYPYLSLRYLPFSALKDGEHYIIEKYAIAMYNVAADTNMKENRQQKWTVAGFGVSKSQGGFPALPDAEEEINAIVKESKTDSQGIMPGSKYMDEAFTQEQLKISLKQKTFQVFHLATHFKLTPGSNKDSYLLTGDKDKPISLEDLAKSDYQMSGKDLITLSACETGVGDGNEIEGLGTQILQKDAHAVIATLWSVADRSTAEFMENFYTLRESKQPESKYLSKAEAIRQTQLIFLGKTTGGVSSSRGAASANPDKAEYLPFSHPYYWAPFILMGNWR